MLVVDASAALAWCFIEERDDSADALLTRCEAEDFCVPALWFLECGNSLLIAERRGRITSSGVQQNFDLLMSLAPTVDPELILQAFGAIPRLARAHRLTTYDATYLELAMRVGAPLATRDQQLKRAALNAGVELIPA